MTAAPIARFALAYAAGVAAGLLSVPIWASLLVALGACIAPHPASRRPLELRGALILVGVAGALAGYGVPADTRSYGRHSPCWADSMLVGRFLTPPLVGSVPMVREDGCGVVTVVLRATSDSSRHVAPIPAGERVRVVGQMREGRRRPWFAATGLQALEAEGRRNTASQRARWSVVRFRGEVVRRIHELYGPRAPLVTALTLARTEGLDRDVRDAFAAAGIAHLLAISGFHVGVVAGLVSAALSRFPWGRRRKRLVAALVTSSYVALIGFPVSACRAALIFVFTSLSVAVGRVPSRWGALGASALFLLWIDPNDLASPGFQLSFAGAAGLVAWARPLESWCVTRVRTWTRRVPRGLTSGVAAGVAATLATLPFVAWHFERVALFGIPATLAATPLVSLALPGAALSVGLATVWEGGGVVLAGGVSVLLDALALVARLAAGTPMASVWVSPPTVLAGCLGVLVATWLARHPRVHAHGRRVLTTAWLIGAVLIWPVLFSVAGRGSFDLWMLDVGQGDAIAMRTPSGSWILVDAGPPSDAEVPAQPVVRALRGLGVQSIDLLVLTHPDADHIGGVPGVLNSFRVERVLDPALPVGKSVYSEAISTAEEEGVPWYAARAGQRFDFDGVTLDVLHPSDSAIAQERMEAGGAEANRVSVVLKVSWYDVDIVLTGDAYVEVEEALASALGDVEILKVGHHGSLTSTSPELLRASDPEYALISVGRFNRYGHPAAEVVSRLGASGARLYRTDLHGTVRVRVGRDGQVRVESER